MLFSFLFQPIQKEPQKKKKNKSDECARFSFFFFFFLPTKGKYEEPNASTSDTSSIQNITTKAEEESDSDAETLSGLLPLFSLSLMCFLTFSLPEERFDSGQEFDSGPEDEEDDGIPQEEVLKKAFFFCPFFFLSLFPLV